MYAVWVEVQVAPGKLERFLEAIAVNAERSVADEPGCHHFDVVELDAAEQRYAFYELYRDREAFTVEHRGAAHYADWKAAAAETLVPGSQVIKEGPRLLSRL